MRVHGRKEAVLNALTALVAVAAAFMLVNDRVLPALAERANVGEGESVGDPLLLRGIDGADTIRIGSDDAAVLVLFQSPVPSANVPPPIGPDWLPRRRVACSRSASRPTRPRSNGGSVSFRASGWCLRLIAPLFWNASASGPSRQPCCSSADVC